MALPTFDFSDQVVVVTGGTRGVGAGIVKAFLAAGAEVVTCGRNEVEVPGALFVTADVRHCIHGADGLPETVSGLHQNPITSIMPVGVVDFLEPIKVER